MKGEPYILAVFGSRTLSDERVRVLLLEEIERTGADWIATAAEPAGVCQIAQEIAHTLPLPLLLFSLDHTKRKGAWAHRSNATLRVATSAVLIWDGDEAGTSNDLQLCIKWGMDHVLHRLEPAREEPAPKDWASILSGV